MRAVFVVALLLLAAVAGGAWAARALYERPGPLDSPRAVVVPRGTPAQVAAALQAAGVLDGILPFRLAAVVTRGDGPLHAAELLFPAHASLAEVFDVLRTGRPVEHRLTIPEGLTAAQVAMLVARTDGLTGDPVVPEEGMVLPETYDFERGTSRAALLARARAAMARALAAAWSGRAPDLPLANPTQLLALASLVERETARPGERAHVAGVFVNRLRLGMKLQSDPTVIYAVAGGEGSLGRRLTRIDLDWPNPYNTYAVTGLPPGPIASPGLAALRAAARPLPTDDLYFVADGAGGHSFARTLQDHTRNVDRLRALTAP